MKKVLSLICAAALLLPLCVTLPSCSSSGEYAVYNYFAMDTYVVLKFSRESKSGSRLSEEKLTEAAENCAAILERIDLSISSHNKDSAVYDLNSTYNMILSADDTLLETLSLADKVSALTDGAYDYTLGTLTELWNVTGGGPEGDGVPPTEDEIKEAMSHCGRDKLSVDGKKISKNDTAAKIDFGGVGKGIATQQLLEYLADTDIAYGIVSLGGNIGVFGKKPEYGSYKVGIRDPHSSGASSVIGYYYLSSGFISVSGDYERYFEHDGVRYHHIIDPSTGYPARSGLSSVAVITSNGAAADALSTALFVMGAEKGLAFYETSEIPFEAIFVTDAGEIVTTPGITDETFEKFAKS